MTIYNEIQNETLPERVITSLAENVTDAVHNYLQALKSEEIVNLFQLVMDEVEPALLKNVLKYCRYNQSKASKILGLSRGTLRTKLRRYFDDQYTTTRQD